MGGGGKETFAMTDVTPNEARMPEDAAVTVTNADTLRAMASPIRMRILGTLRVNGEQTVGSISEQLRGSGGHQLSLGAACTGGTGGEGEVS